MNSEQQNPNPDLRTAKQRAGIRRTVFVMVLAVLVVLGLIVAKVLREPEVNREALREQGVILFDQPRKFTDFSLIDHRGEDYTQEDLKGQWTVIFFGFTQCPDICPITLADLSRLMKALPEPLAEDTQVLMVTLDPARDTPEVLAKYVPYFHPEFIGITGDFLTIKRFANELNVAFAKVTLEDDYTVDHSGHLSLINPRGDYHALLKPPFETEKMQSALSAIRRNFPD